MTLRLVFVVGVLLCVPGALILFFFTDDEALVRTATALFFVFFLSLFFLLWLEGCTVFPSLVSERFHARKKAHDQHSH